MAYIKTLIKNFFKNMDDISNEEEHIYPVTSTEAVYDKNNNTLDSIITSVKNSLKVINSNVEQLSTKINNIAENNNSTLWKGCIIQKFDNIVYYSEEDIIEGSPQYEQGQVVWHPDLRKFLFQVDTEPYLGVYTYWSNYSNFMDDSGKPIQKLFKKGTEVYYYDLFVKDLVNINTEIPDLVIHDMIDTASYIEVNGFNYDIDDLDIVFVQNITNDSEKKHAGFLYRESNKYYFPVSDYDKYKLSKYQSSSFDITDKIIYYKDRYLKYNSTTETLEYVQ